ncbi:MAG: HesA/MoeB/ThiF family protein [Bacteroidales bacterium]|nr:HesA/MoeB/ThiF family protein [Bacteroidales bacterium]
MLSERELERYNRQLQIPFFGEIGQEKLKHAKVLVIGVGGLGSVASVYLVAAGFGTVGIMDKDTVALHNLQRQVLYREDEVGMSKLQLAEKSLARLNSFVNIKAYESFLTKENAEEIIKDFDIVLDCTDNYAARYLINDTCVSLGKPFIYGTIGDTKGQMAVFNYKSPSANYRDLYPEQEALQEQGNINKGVMGVLPSVIASLQVNEAVKMVTGIGEVMKDTLFMIDLMSLNTMKFKIKHKE